MEIDVKKAENVENKGEKEQIASKTKTAVIENVEKTKEETKKTTDKENGKKDNEVKTPKVKTSKPKIYIISGCIIIFILILLSMIFALLNIFNENIIKGVCIENISIGGLSKEQAINKIENELKQIKNNQIIVENKENNFEYKFNTEQIALNYNVEKAIDEAFNYGRNENIFKNNAKIVKALFKGENIEIDYVYNEALLLEIINDIARNVPNPVLESEHYIEGEELVINSGKEGNSIDKEDAKIKISNNIHEKKNENIKIEIINKLPNKIDIEKIYKDVFTEPMDAYYTKNPFKIYEHVDGVDFNIEEAKALLNEEKEEYRVPVTITHPNILTSQIGTEAFPDLLGSFSTKYNTSLVERSNNLKIAASKINGVIVNPGEIFSYNKTVGERTYNAGYRDAAGYSGGKVVDMLGGGICQVSSTLYDAVVYANLEIVERHNHAFLTSYTTAGRDATVVYGALDFKFKNTRNYPVMIKMTVQNGVAKADIFGIKEETEYTIDIDTTILSYISYGTVYEDDENLLEGQEKVTQNGMRGCKSVTYKITKVDGVETNREVLSNDTYNAMNKIISRGVKKAEVKQEEKKPVSPPTPTNSTTNTQTKPNNTATSQNSTNNSTTNANKVRENKTNTNTNKN